MGSNQSQNFNKDVEIKGDINVYICGDINYKSNQKNHITNYDIIKKIFNKEMPENNGNIRAENFIKDIYPYEFRKLEKQLKDNNIKKNYNAFLFFNEVDEKFSQILIEEHLYEKDVHNKNNNIIIYFGENNFIKNSIEKLNSKSKETVPFLLIVRNTPNYSEELKYINDIPNIESIPKILTNQTDYDDEELLNKHIFNSLQNYILMKLLRIDMYYNQLGFNLNLANAFNDINSNIKMNLTIGLVGYSGCGKSTLINLIFDELVCKTSSSGTDVTTKCTEYYLPIKYTKSDHFGQIRFLDFPGISEEKNFYNVVEPEIKNKIKEYQKNKEQIDIVLFYIHNGIGREFTEAGKKLVNLLYKNKIKIIFIINGEIKPFFLEEKKKKIKNIINNNEILHEDFNNLISTDYYQYYNYKSKNGISKICEKIIEEIKIKNQGFKIEDITVENFNEKLLLLKNSSRLFEFYNNLTNIKDSIKTKAYLTVTSFSALSCGTSSLSLIFPLVDAVAAIGYQVAMVYSIFSLYELDPNNYKIKEIILSGGNSIEEAIADDNLLKIADNGKEDDKDKTNNKKNEVTNGNIREIIGDTAKGAVFAGQIGVQNLAAKEAGKVILERSVKTVVEESIEIGTIKASLFSMEASVRSATMLTVSNTVEKIAIESSKELVEQGLTQGTKIAIEATKESIILASTEGFETAVTYGSKESIKTITESIVIQQGGKTWLVNLGKYIPFIGAGISAFMNTFSTAKIGIKLVSKLDEEFDNNNQKKVNVVKGKIYALFNIINQLRKIGEMDNIRNIEENK